ncbi:MAG: hypothetical protein OXJ37_03365 [Bryobacterales bacterium]|nr:hypothetical protein [Bryobacterales bacterium]
MPQWIGSVATVAATLVAIAALIVSIWAGRRAARKREFEVLLERIDQEATKREERIDREAAKREAETRALMERIDREAAKREQQFEKEAAKREQQFEREAARREEQFEKEAAKREEAIRALLRSSDTRFEALQRRSDELYRQSAEVTARVAHNEAALDAVAESTPARGETEAVAAQDVSVGQPRE